MPNSEKKVLIIEDDPAHNRVMYGARQGVEKK